MRVIWVYNTIHICSICPATPANTKLTPFTATHNTLDGGYKALLQRYIKGYSRGAYLESQRHPLLPASLYGHHQPLRPTH
jgi:hypothetical protein